MSKIQDIIGEHEWRCNEGHPPNETGRHIVLLQALDVLADELHRIGDIMEAEEESRFTQELWKVSK